ncbi:MAG: ParB/RepB/Spo0J family partition protein [Deltaproteobacteria bacterium]|nr:ParB/RepB/Spo0J family partition protein [Deltaproteobacteria bacterium]MBK8237864.1 ParB/RepB/Spo0J family partition protein [Deltaproteobacteria bacterium]MBK8720631.1 ParB/RepB/Spo0J family partition protein [Deltaproteobacteria bacterium]MBP7291527.1 ParB/RepB/Spo0J family partition protein [Nannocystaceae bacterium]
MNATKPPKRPALGRGLGALIPPVPAAATAAVSRPEGVEPHVTRHGPSTLPIEALLPSPDQPRKRFDPELLEQLAASIRAQGIIQPIVVSPLAQPDKGGARYVIIAGERRWRAAQLAGLHDVPVVIRDSDEQQRLELALVENLQRAELNPIEEARAFAELLSIRGYTQEQLAERVGKDRSTVANAMRLLRLPERVQEMVRDERLSMGHARALLGLEQESEIAELAHEAARGQWSVRAVERAVRTAAKAARSLPRPADEDADRRRIIVTELEHRLQRRLGTRVRLRTDPRKRGAGVVEIPYASLDELDRLLHILLDDSATFSR